MYGDALASFRNTGAAERLVAAADVGVAGPTDERASDYAESLVAPLSVLGLNSFQCPSEMISTVSSTTLIAV